MVTRKYDKDIRFVIYATVFALLFMAAMHGLNPHLRGPDPRRAEIEAFIPNIKPVNVSDISARVETHTDKPTLLVLYASWCSSCRAVMPYYMQWQQAGKLDAVHQIFLSIDSSPMKFSTYLVHSDFTSRFTPYMLRQGESSRFRQFIADKGGNYGGYIPYVVLFDKSGRVAREFAGGEAVDNLLSFIDNLP